jgi:hypothetical protein
MMFVRILIGYAFAIPAIAAGIVAGFIIHSPVLAIVIAAVTAMLETSLLIGFASWRLDRMSIPLA